MSSHWGTIAVLCTVIWMSLTYTGATEVPTTTTSTPPSSTTANLSSTTPSLQIECSHHNDSCKSCVANPKCLWCETLHIRCIPYPTGSIIPSSEVCKLTDAKWGVCWVNYQILLIVMGCVAGVIILSFMVCVYCCCCRSKGPSRRRGLKKLGDVYAREEERIERDREQRHSRNDERRAQRQSRIDDIRAKYGLNNGAGYRRFENDNEVA